MRRSGEALVRRIWHGDGGAAAAAGALLAAPAVLFGAGVRVRNLLFDRGARPVRAAPLPVVSVGNVSVGGTGKTPVARWVVERLVAAGRRPALVARGYGRDELLLHRRWNPDVPVIASPRRIHGAREAAGRGADVCVLDDGFQHRQLERDLDIVLLAASDPLPPRLLPRGPYREPLRNVRRADVVLVTWRAGAEEARAGALAKELARTPGFPPVYPLRLAASGWRDLAGAQASAPGEAALVFASVARPEGVAHLARELGAEVSGLLAFPDHHEYGAADIDRIRREAGGRPLVTTEKDAVKLEGRARDLGAVRVLALEARPAAPAEGSLLEALAALPEGTPPAREGSR